MTPNQIDLVQRSWRQVLPVADRAAQMFYERLFTLDPSLPLLSRGEMKERGQKLMGMISFAVDGLSQLGRLRPAVQVLELRHDGHGVREEHYVTVGSALLWALEQNLGSSFTSAVREAWVAAYAVLANTKIWAGLYASDPNQAVAP